MGWVEEKQHLDRLRAESAGRQCPYCGTAMDDPTADHIIPKSKGGGRHRDNIMFICQPCNADKADLSLPEWYWQLQLGGDRRAARVRKVLDRKDSRLWVKTSEAIVKAGGSHIEPSGWG